MKHQSGEIIDEASRPESPVRIQQVIIDPNQLAQKTRTVVSQPNLSTMLGVQPDGATERTETPDDGQPAVFETPGDLEVARLAHAAIRRLENQPGEVPSITHLQKPEVQAVLVSDVADQPGT